VSVEPQQLVLAMTQVVGASKACKRHGDAAAFANLEKYYALVARAVSAIDGRVIKVLGDGMLLAFPISRARDAINVLRRAQQDANALWRGFDEGCRVQVKVTAGEVLVGKLGAPGEERFDVYGDTLNMLFKPPWDDFLIAPPAEALLSG
jgi:class 3 adenylate cyclase